MIERLRWLLASLGLLLLLTACAAKPIETDVVPGDLTPSDASEALPDDEEIVGTTVLWGGVIVSSSNLANATQLEILAYPLNSRQRPQPSKPAEGRFLVIADGYLETVDFAAGRLLTVLGQLDGTTEGLIGESRYRYPTVKSERLHLWSEKEQNSRSGFSFGLGISL